MFVQWLVCFILVIQWLVSSSHFILEGQTGSVSSRNFSCHVALRSSGCRCGRSRSRGPSSGRDWSPEPGQLKVSVRRWSPGARAAAARSPGARSSESVSGSAAPHSGEGRVTLWATLQLPPPRGSGRTGLGPDSDRTQTGLQRTASPGSVVSLRTETQAGTGTTWRSVMQ